MGDKNCCAECYVPEHDSEGEDYRGALPESCTDEGCQCHDSFAEKKLKVAHADTTHYEVVWADGKPMTKVSDNVFLK